jgi:peptidoglycan/xylan/chitin deacetylase (PgdA/CDA1 family)
MQSARMLIGGHSHRHRPLATFTVDELKEDLHNSRRLLAQNLQSQPLWPFSYPYGKPESFNESVIAELKQLGFDCAFTTVSGSNTGGTEAYTIRRVDCKQVSGDTYASKVVGVAS